MLNAALVSSSLEMENQLFMHAGADGPQGRSEVKEERSRNEWLFSFFLPVSSASSAPLSLMRELLLQNTTAFHFLYRTFVLVLRMNTSYSGMHVYFELL